MLCFSTSICFVYVVVWYETFHSYVSQPPGIFLCFSFEIFPWTKLLHPKIGDYLIYWLDFEVEGWGFPEEGRGWGIQGRCDDSPMQMEAARRFGDFHGNLRTWVYDKQSGRRKKMGSGALRVGSQNWHWFVQQEIQLHCNWFTEKFQLGKECCITTGLLGIAQMQGPERTRMLQSKPQMMTDLIGTAGWRNGWEETGPRYVPVRKIQKTCCKNKSRLYNLLH